MRRRARAWATPRRSCRPAARRSPRRCRPATAAPCSCGGGYKSAQHHCVSEAELGTVQVWHLNPSEQNL